MDHSYIEKNEIAEKYLLHGLTLEEESEFEKHLLQCQTCRDELEYLKKIRSLANEGLFKQRATHKEKKQSKVFGIQYFYRYAAAGIILLGLGFLLHRTLQLKNSPKTATIESTIDSVKADTSNHITDQKIISDVQITEQKETVPPSNINNELLAQAFEPSEFFEGMIEVQYRSPSVQVETPKSGQNFTTSKNIKWSWQSSEYDSLNLAIFNNKEKVLFETYIGTSYKLTQKLECGIYYWQLESSDEALHIGKFTIGKQTD